MPPVKSKILANTPAKKEYLKQRREELLADVERKQRKALQGDPLSDAEDKKIKEEMDRLTEKYNNAMGELYARANELVYYRMGLTNSHGRCAVDRDVRRKITAKQREKLDQQAQEELDRELGRV